MRNINCQALSAADNQTTNGLAVEVAQMASASWHSHCSDTNAAGTLKVQVSDDIGVSIERGPTNWTDLANATATITSGGAGFINVATLNAQWARAVYTSTATGAQTVATIADTGVKQVQTVTTVPDVSGSLNSKYFLLSSVNLVTKAQKNFYMWFDDGGGVDPAPAGKTAIHITYSDNDTANTLATSMRTALNALTNDFVATGANAAVIITNAAQGLVPAAADGAAATGFTFANTTAGVASNLNNTYFLLNSGNNTRKYYVWNNVSSIGTDPAPAGLTGIEVDFAAHATAATIGSALATAVAAAHSSGDFTTSGTSTVTITNQASGPFTPASDSSSPTGFTFTQTAGGTGTITVNMNAWGV